jgi:hypothetical protein
MYTGQRETLLRQHHRHHADGLHRLFDVGHHLACAADARTASSPSNAACLYAMLREGLLHNRPFDKCAGVVGEVLKN